MSEVKRYSSLQNIDFAAIPSIPDHWNVKKFRHVARLVQRKNRDKVERPMLSLSAYRGLEIKQYDDENLIRTKAESLEYLVVEPDQLVINPMWVIYGAIGVSKLQGIVSPAYRVYNLSNDISPEYCDYLLKSHFYIKDYNRYIRGLTTYDRSVRKEDFHEIPVLLPPREEQDAIVAFLNYKLAEIDRFIVNKERLIGLLKEQKAAIVNQAVTQGINPSVKMKSSGIQFLGDIPEHWVPLRVRFLLTLMEQGWSPQCEARLKNENEWGVLKVGCVNGYTFNEMEHKALPNNLEPRTEYEIKVGDVLISRANTRELVGGTAYVENVSGKLLLCDKLYRVRLKKDIVPLFFVCMLSALTSRFQIELNASGASSSMQNIGQDVIKDLWVTVPSAEEQLEIMAYISRKTLEVQEMIDRAKNEVELIKEYRTTLISDVVTGKVDVRTAIKEEMPV